MLFNVVFTGGPPIQNSGGPVIANASIVAVYLGAVWNFDPGLQLQRAQIDNFLAYFAKSPYIQGLSEYGVRSAVFSGDVVDPGTFYASQVPDAAIRTDLNVFTMTRGQSPGVVFLCIAPPGITISRGEGSDYPAYHDAFLNGYGQPVVYAMVTQTLGPSQVPGAANGLDVVTAMVSHELAESFTDPLGGLGELAWAQLPEGTLQGEICDTYGGVTARANGYLLSDFWSDDLGVPYVPGGNNPFLKPAPTISLSGLPSVVKPGQSFTITASVTYPITGGYGEPTGTVHFTAIRALGTDLNSGVGAPIDCGTAIIGSNGVALRSISLPLGDYNITCTYSGDSTFAMLSGTPFRESVRNSVTTPVGPKLYPPNPTNLIARAGALGHIVLTWAPHTTTDTGFILQRSTDSTFRTYTRIKLPAHRYSYVDSNLPIGTRVYYRLYAYNADGPSRYFTNVAYAVVRGLPSSHQSHRKTTLSSVLETPNPIATPDERDGT